MAAGQSFEYLPKPRAGGLDVVYASPDPAPRAMPPAEATLPSPAADSLSARPIPRRRPYRAPTYKAQTDGYPIRRTAGMEAVPTNPRGGFLVSNPTTSSVVQPVPDPLINAPPVGGPVYAASPIDGQVYMDAPCNSQPCTGQTCTCPGGQHIAEVDYCAPQQVGEMTKLEEWFSNTWLGNPTIWQNFNELSGVQGFKGPVDQGVNGNFGFHKGVNWAVPAIDAIGLGYQLGGVIEVSDLSGGAGPVNSTREQYFITSGLFRRAQYNSGLQAGAVVDYLHDNFYTRINLLQVRAEGSYVWHSHEVGLWSAVHLRSDTQTPPAWFGKSSVTWQSNDQFNLFYRYTFCNGGVARMWIGLSGVGDLIFGSDATAPLSERWAIQAVYNYLIPRADPSIPNAIKETWGVTVSLIWYPGYRVPNACFNPYRPLFTVADNGTFMIRQK
jgi:hypothetical protein